MGRRRSRVAGVTGGEHGGQGWRDAMTGALYGPARLLPRPAPGPADHFRTSVHASPLVRPRRVLRLVERIDAALGHPDTFDVVDVGAGRGRAAHRPGRRHRRPPGPTPAAATADSRPETRPPPPPTFPARGPLAERLRFTGGGGRRAARRAGRRRSTGGTRVPDGITGLLDRHRVAGQRPARRRRGRPGRAGPPGARRPDHRRRDPRRPTSTRPTRSGWPAGGPWTDGRTGDPRRDRLDPGRRPGPTRSARVEPGCALAVDYGHLRAGRPRVRDADRLPGRPPGAARCRTARCDVTAHVAMDSVAAARRVRRTPCCRQREALRALGVDGGRPAAGAWPAPTPAGTCGRWPPRRRPPSSPTRPASAGTGGCCTRSASTVDASWDDDAA